MSQHLMSLPIKLGQCARCQSYVFSCQVGGAKVTADPIPLDVDQYREALIAGRPVYRLISQAGRPWKLETDTASVPNSRDLPLVAAHGCGASALDAPKVEEVPVNPLRGSVRTGATRGGPRPHIAPGVAQRAVQAPSRAQRASRPRSERPGHPCAQCGATVRPDHPAFAIQHGYRVLWAIHDACPTKE